MPIPEPFRLAPVPFTTEEQRLVHAVSVPLPNETDEEAADRIVIAEMLLATVIGESRTAGSYDFPSNLGDLVLSGALPEKDILRQWVVQLRESLPRKYADGMSNQEFLRFWNRPDVVRRLFITAFSNNIDDRRAVLHTDFLWSDEPSDDFDQQLKYSFGFYSHNSEIGEGENRALPLEVMHAVMLAASDNPFSKYRADIVRAGSFNAYYRQSVDLNFG